MVTNEHQKARPILENLENVKHVLELRIMVMTQLTVSKREDCMKPVLHCQRQSQTPFQEQKLEPVIAKKQRTAFHIIFSPGIFI